MTVHLFDRSNLIATPWKNGGGVTREIACRVPPAVRDFQATTPCDDSGRDGHVHASGQFEWRISIAHIANDSPFSAFDGVDRVITLLEGSGVRLQSADGGIDHRLDHPLTPFAFPGEVPIQGTLLAGDCHAMNVMTQRDRCQADVMILRESGELRATPDGLLMAIDGEWCVRSNGGEGVRLRARTGFWWQEQRETWQIERLPGVASEVRDDAAILVVSIER